jgi:hypothetical protein
MINYYFDLGNATIHDPQFQKLMKEESFDLLVLGFTFNAFLLGIGDHFKCPIIMVASAGVTPVLSYIVGHPSDFSAVPHYLMPSEKMDFSDRLKSLFAYSVEYLLTWYTDHKNRQFYDLMFPPEKYRTFEEMKRNVSLILFNDHYTQGRLQALLPNTVEVGGLQIKAKPSPLPENLQKWIDGAVHGVIFFSFGSNAKATYLPKEKIDIFMAAFAKLKQRVIFKWEADTLPGKPDNVLTGKWLPQDDILAHKNVKIFISHCGIGSVREAKFHSVPVISIPLFTDQMSNADTIVKEGWGIRLDFKTLKENDLVDAIQEILGNPKYKENVQHLSNLYRDRPISALETAVFWVEHIIRHHGAPHLHYFGADQNFIQRNSLDVFGFLAIVFSLILWIVVRVSKFVWRKFLGLIGSKKSVGKKKKN